MSWVLAMAFVVVILVIAFRAPRYELPRAGLELPEAPPFEYLGSSDNDKVVAIVGIPRRSAETALDEFIALYSMEAFAADGILMESDGDVHRITFPNDSPALHFLWLVDYLGAPFMEGPVGRVIGATTLSDEFEELECPVAGLQAAFYRPTNADAAVHMVTESGECWEFTWHIGGGWSRVEPPDDLTMLREYGRIER